MKQREALQRIDEITRVAERTTLYTLLPGWPAIIGGILALAGCLISYAMLDSLDFSALYYLTMNGQLAFCAMWGLVAVVAVGQDVALTAVRARRMGIRPVGRPGRFSAYALTPSVFVAMVLTARLLSDGLDATPDQLRLIAPVCMMCYGTGVYTAGLFSVRLPRVLGAAFILIGALGLVYFPTRGLLLTAISFGGLHIVFGAIVLCRSGQDGEP